jgi:hypothetical protein
MGCFTAPLTLGIATTVLRKRIPAKYHVNWLNAMLWGGTAGLIIEHIAHQEVVPYFPFLTAMSSPADTAVMFHEILTVGGMMIVASVAAWAVMVAAAWHIEAKVRTDARQPLL